MPEASPTDVRVEIDTHLDDADISDILGRIAREIDREYDGTSISFQDTQHRQDFEAALTALRIAEGRDRRAESATSGATTTSYEADEIEQLRKRVRRDDPGEAFGTSGMTIRRDNRSISTTTDDH